jgi:hypothetical protein
MLNDFLLSLFSFFILDPFQAELNQKLRAAQAPAAVMAEVRACATAAGPVLIDRALNDWWWVGTTVISVGVGMTTPQSVLVEIAPRCASAVRNADVFITAGRV